MKNKLDEKFDLLWEALENIPAFLNLRYEDRASIISVVSKVFESDEINDVVEEVESVDENIQVYVDGSYNKDNNLTAAGVVVLYNEKVYKKAFLVETEESHSWNIDGECHAVLEALRICAGEVMIDDVKINQKNIVVNYDYEGIEKWATRQWKVKSKIARHYIKEFESLVSKYNLNVTFNKIKAHSGDQYNEMADGLAYAMTMSVK